MILQKEFWTENIEIMKKLSSNYMVLDLEMYKQEADKKKLEPGFHIVNLCNIIRMVNDSLGKVGVSEAINFSILGDVVKAIYNKTPFNDEQLDEFLEFNIQLESTARALQNISHISEDLYFPVNILMHLVGFDFEKQEEFAMVDKVRFGLVDDDFYELQSEAIEKKLPAHEFKRKGLELMMRSFEQVKDGRLSNL